MAVVFMDGFDTYLVANQAVLPRWDINQPAWKFDGDLSGLALAYGTGKYGKALVLKPPCAPLTLDFPGQDNSAIYCFMKLSVGAEVTVSLTYPGAQPVRLSTTNNCTTAYGSEIDHKIIPDSWFSFSLRLIRGGYQAQGATAVLQLTYYENSSLVVSANESTTGTGDIQRSVSVAVVVPGNSKPSATGQAHKVVLTPSTAGISGSSGYAVSLDHFVLVNEPGYTYAAEGWQILTLPGGTVGDASSWRQGYRAERAGMELLQHVVPLPLSLSFNIAVAQVHNRYSLYQSGAFSPALELKSAGALVRGPTGDMLNPRKLYLSIGTVMFLPSINSKSFWQTGDANAMQIGTYVVYDNVATGS